MINLDSGEFIFKYYPVSLNLVKTLTYNEIWFSPIKNFNDPFEAEFKIVSLGGNESEYADYFYSKYKGLEDENLRFELERFNQNPEQLYNDLKESYRDFLDDNYGVTCFSKKYNDVLMWSHYANSHKGVCLVFNKKQLYKSFKSKNINVFEPIDIYTDKIIEVKTGFTTVKANFEDPERILQFKSKLWEYEEEVRFVKKRSSITESRFVSLTKNSLTAIIFGERIDSEDEYLVYKLGKQLNKKLPFLKAEKDLIENRIKVDKSYLSFVIGHKLYKF